MSTSHKTVSLDPAASRIFFNALDCLTTAFPSFLHFATSPFCLMMRRTAPQAKIDMLRQVSSGSLNFKTWGSSLEVTIPVLATYGMGGQLLSCPFLHLELFNLLGVMRVVLILGYCQSLVLTPSFLKEDFGRTRRNPAAWMVPRKKFAECKTFWFKKTLACADSARTTGWMAWYRIFWPLQNALLNLNRVLNSKCPKHSAK